MEKDKLIRESLRSMYSVLVTANKTYGPDSKEAEKAKELYLSTKKLRDEIEKGGQCDA